MATLLTGAERAGHMPRQNPPREVVDHGVQIARAPSVDLDFLEVFQTPILAGRGFAPQHTGVGTNTVVVNHLSVDQILAGRNAVGRCIGYRVEDSQAIVEPGPSHVPGQFGQAVPLRNGLHSAASEGLRL